MHQQSERRHVEAVVLGGGASGIGAVIRLRRDAGIEDVVLLEKSDELGGTWHHNRYPGCACDIPSCAYSFEFAPNPDWSRTFAPQPEIEAYLQRVAAEHDVYRHAILGAEVTAARWDEDDQRWLIDSTKGSFSTPIFIFGVGALHEPSVPDVPGIERFAGEQFHSAEWDDRADLRGKRVALIGSGASAVQILPHVRRDAASVVYLQRTPGWVWPKPDWRSSRLERWLYRHVPLTQRILRRCQFEFADLLLLAYLDTRIARLLNVIGRLHILATVRGRAARRAVTPRYALGCKRVMLSNSYYPALSEPDVTLVPHGLREVRPHAIVAADGSEHEVDAIIWATGFKALDPPFLDRMVGRRGRTLADTWQGHPSAYMGASTPGFPNAFQIWGPNAGTANHFTMLEAQLNYALSAIELLRREGLASVDVRSEVVAAWKREQTERMAGSTWRSGGCASWYQDAVGEVHAVYGGTQREFLRRSRVPVHRGLFDVRPAERPRSAETVAA